MPALRILLLALTRRLAIAGSEARNARAISAVVRPARVLSVRATRASSGSAGWQQVNIRRSLSSWMPLSSSASRPESSSLRCIIATSSNLAAPVALRLKRSRARLRTMVVSHAPGRRGTPSRGQVSSARSKAPWAHSSARSQSPVVRIRVATIRPHSSRKASATAASTRPATRGGLVGPPPQLTTLPFPKRPDLDRAELRNRVPGGHLDGIVEVGALDDVEAPHLLLGLRERAVREQDLVFANPHRGGFTARTQPRPAPQHPRRSISSVQDRYFGSSLMVAGPGTRSKSS